MGRLPLCLGHLTALEQLTIRGANCDWYLRDFSKQLGQDGTTPALPASLTVLRLGESARGIYTFLWGNPPYDPLPKAPSSVTIPVLELQGDGVLLLFDGSSTIKGDRANCCCLPPGFASLRLCTGGVDFHTTGTPNVVWRPTQTPPEEEMCRFFEVAPQCYREFTICTPTGEPPMAAPAVGLQSHDGPEYCRRVAFSGLEALADAMRRSSAAGIFDISVLHDQQCVRVTRPGTTA